MRGGNLQFKDIKIDIGSAVYPQYVLNNHFFRG